MGTFMSLIAKRAKGGTISPTFKLAAKARELIEQGIEVLNLSIGEPECGTPINIKEAACKAIQAEKTKYTQVNGIAELRKAIYKKYLNRIGKKNFSLDNIIVSSGAKYILYSFLWSVLNKGDEVILPAPYWVSYGSMVTMNEGVPINIYCEEKNNFKVTVEQLEKEVPEKSKVLFINSPNNPSGTKYSKDELKEIVTFVRKHPNLNVLSDDIYEDFSYDDDVYSMIDIAPEMLDRIFIVNGVSKSHAMTGWRLGYGLGNKEVIDAMKVMQSQSLSSPCSISQYAALEALTGEQTIVKDYIQMLKKRRDLVYKFFTETDGFSCSEPSGTFYVFPNCEKFIDTITSNGKEIKNDEDFCNYLLEEENVSVIPGSVFGIKNHFRLSYAVTDEVLKKALSKIKQATDKLKLPITQ